MSAPSAQKIATIALALLILSLSIIDWHVPRCFRSHQLLCRILTAMSMQALRVELACTVIAFVLPTFGKRSQDQGSTSRKRSTPTRPATEQTPEIPADAEATMQDPGNASILRCSDSAVEPDAATEHIAPASFGSAGEASSGCGDMTIKSLDDVVSKLSSHCDDSAAALRNAVQTLQRGVQAEIRNLCKPWGVQLTAKNDNGKYSKRADAVLKRELKDKVIAKAKASSGCGDMTIMSLDDVASKFSSDYDDSAAALRNAVQTLQRAPSRRQQAEMRNLCKPWGVKLTAKNDNGKYSKRAGAVLKSELKDKVIAKAKEHFRASRFGSGTSPP